jgi:hypothetical protein
VFAALAQNPRLIEPMRAAYAELRRRLAEDGLPAGVSETVLAALDGLWLNRVLGLAPVDQGRMNQIRRTLDGLVAQARPPARATAPVRPSRPRK